MDLGAPLRGERPEIERVVNRVKKSGKKLWARWFGEQRLLIKVETTLFGC